MSTPGPAKRLYRSRSERMLFGVCGGLGSYFDLDPTIVRLVFVLLIFASGVGFILYIVLAIVTPEEPITAGYARPATAGQQSAEAVAEAAREIGERAEKLGEEASAAFRSLDLPPAATGWRGSRQLFGLILLLVGAAFLLTNLDLFPWLRWSVIWPLVLVGIGVWLLLNRTRR